MTKDLENQKILQEPHYKYTSQCNIIIGLESIEMDTQLYYIITILLHYTLLEH